MDLCVLKLVAHCWSLQNLEKEMVPSVNVSVGVPLSQDCEAISSYDMQSYLRNSKYECEWMNHQNILARTVVEVALEEHCKCRHRLLFSSCLSATAVRK